VNSISQGAITNLQPGMHFLYVPSKLSMCAHDFSTNIFLLAYNRLC